MSCFKSKKFDEVFVVTKLTKEENEKYFNKCDKTLFKQFYIANIEALNNNKKKSFKYDIERIICGTKIIHEEYKINYF